MAKVKQLITGDLYFGKGLFKKAAAMLLSNDAINVVAATSLYVATQPMINPNFIDNPWITAMFFLPIAASGAVLSRLGERLEAHFHGVGDETKRSLVPVKRKNDKTEAPSLAIKKYARTICEASLQNLKWGIGGLLAGVGLAAAFGGDATLMSYMGCATLPFLARQVDNYWRHRKILKGAYQVEKREPRKETPASILSVASSFVRNRMLPLVCDPA
ncbi:MAG: hypothetical protein AB7E52_02940 [Bdellovibrionales bacterium]